MTLASAAHPEFPAHRRGHHAASRRIRWHAAWAAVAAIATVLGVPAAHAQPAKAAASAPADPRAVPTTAAALPAGAKVLRFAFPIAETGFDPAQVTDFYSATLVSNIFEAPLTYTHLQRPATLRPATAEAMPEVSADFKTFTFRIKPGIHFADDPAFGGRKRELTAQDYVYSIKRHYDPKNKSGRLQYFEQAKILGLSELRKKALDTKKPFDYDTEVEGLRAPDRYTLVIKLGEPSPRFAETMAIAAQAGAVAREVVEYYGDAIMGHPVGTGPFKLAAWRRSSKIVLDRNPEFRDERFDEAAPAGDAEAQRVAALFKGRKLPMLDRVEVSIIEESQPRWLSFLDDQFDLMDRLPNEFAPQVVPNGKLAPNLAARGLQAQRYNLPDVTMTYFAMENPIVGGYTPDKVALRRALALAYDSDREIAIVRKGQAIVAQSMVPPLLSGYDPKFRSEMSEYSPERAKALLDLFGYVDKNGDGWRDQPDGKPLVLEIATQPDQLSRQISELWQRTLDSVRIKVTFKQAKWPENLKASRAGKLMMWGVAWNGGGADGADFTGLLYGPNKGQSNHARFDLPAYNKLFEAHQVLPDGPERDALYHQMKLIGAAYMPVKMNAHRIGTDLTQPRVQGYLRHPFRRDWFAYVDIDHSKQAASKR